MTSLPTDPNPLKGQNTLESGLRDSRQHGLLRNCGLLIRSYLSPTLREEFLAPKRCERRSTWMSIFTTASCPGCFKANTTSEPHRE